MRLIDIDEAEKLFNPFRTSSELYTYNTLENLATQFTVEAIPVEWLRERASRMLDFGEGVERIIKEWKDEQSK